MNDGANTHAHTRPPPCFEARFQVSVHVFANAIVGKGREEFPLSEKIHTRQELTFYLKGYFALMRRRRAHRLVGNGTLVASLVVVARRHPGKRARCRSIETRLLQAKAGRRQQLLVVLEPGDVRLRIAAVRLAG